MDILFIEFLKDLNIGNLVAIGVMFWFFYRRLDCKLEKLSEKVEDVDKRLCRIEGSLSIHGHCLFNQNHSEKKAQ